jgi:hypothetical protein
MNKFKMQNLIEREENFQAYNQEEWQGGYE